MMINTITLSLTKDCEVELLDWERQLHENFEGKITFECKGSTPTSTLLGFRSSVQGILEIKDSFAKREDCIDMVVIAVDEYRQPLRRRHSHE
jgi:hypothetical protein